MSYLYPVRETGKVLLAEKLGCNLSPMKLAKAHIKNFRSIKEVEIEFDNLTRLIGANGSGKSTVLKAIELFYTHGTPNIAIEDFYNRQVNEEIEITLTFTNFTDTERTMFAKRISQEGEMAVSRVFTSQGGKSNGKYHGITLSYPEFAAVRATEGAREKVAAYRQLRTIYQDLDGAITTGGAVEAALLQWEEANPQRCVPVRDDGQFFGFQNVAQGKLQYATSLVFIPAVRDAAQDCAEGKGTPITLLMDLLVRSAIESKGDMTEFKAATETRFRELTSPDNLPELENLESNLTQTLQDYYPQAGVVLKWQENGPLVIPLPKAGINLEDEGFPSTVERTGHGLQRALIMTLLQHLAAETIRNQPINEEQTEVGQEGTPQLPEPSLILMIEEPELYQHPTKQRHFAKLLENLSAGSIPGVASRTQVIYCTHSPLFVSMDRFEETRLVTRSLGDNGNRETAVNVVSLNDVAIELETAHQRPAGTFTATTLKPRLHTIDAEISEGFFASVAVLVEGPSDKAAILAQANVMGMNFSAEEISILVAHGKNNIDKPYSIFRKLGIPVYPIWDSDKVKDARVNRALQRLVGIRETQLQDVLTTVQPNFACFESILERTLEAEIGKPLLDELLEAQKEIYGLDDRDDALKVPAIMTQILRKAAEQGKISNTLQTIVEAIFAMRPQPANTAQTVEGELTDAA